MSLALMFPGQGSQSPGFLHALPNQPAIQETLQEASELLGKDVLSLDSETALTSTVATQMALVVAGAAFARLCSSAGIQPIALAGMSVGVYSAAIAAESIDLSTALFLVRRRAELMEQAFPAGAYGMAVVEGLNLRTVQTLLEKTDTAIANYNSATQFVVSGKLDELHHVLQKSILAGAHTAKLLRMSVASHVPALLSAAKELNEFAQEFHFAPPRIPIYSNRTARALTTAESVREELASNMAYPVRWHDIVAVLESVGITLLLESPPGHTLSRLASTILPGISAIPVSEQRWDVVLRAAMRESN